MAILKENKSYLFLNIASLIFLLASCNEANLSEKELNPTKSVSQIESLKVALINVRKKNDSLEAKFRSLEQTSTGEFEELESDNEKDAYGFNYRVEIYLSEIYKSFYLTKIEYYGEGTPRINSTYKIDLEKELNISPEETNDLEFIKWNSPFKFEIKVNNKAYFIKIINSKKVKIEENNTPNKD